MRGSPRTGFLFAPFCHVRVLYVKVLLERNEILLGKINVIEALTEIGASKGSRKTSATIASTASVASTTAASVATATRGAAKKK
jgi:hypothetical protein